MIFLQLHLWGLDEFEGNEATAYGKEVEPTARRCYELYSQLASLDFLKVTTTGLWISKEYPMLGCSPDRIVTSSLHAPKLLEIKCPFSLRNEDPNDFDKVL